MKSLLYQLYIIVKSMTIAQKEAFRIVITHSTTDVPTRGGW